MSGAPNNRNEILSVLSFSKYAHDIDAWNALTDEEKVSCFAMWRKHKAYPYMETAALEKTILGILMVMMTAFMPSGSKEGGLNPRLHFMIILGAMSVGYFGKNYVLREQHDLLSMKTYSYGNDLPFLLENPIRFEASLTPYHEREAKALPKAYFGTSILRAPDYESIAKKTGSPDFIANSTFSKMNALFKQSFALSQNPERLQAILEQMSSEDIRIPRESVLSTMLYFARDTDDHLAKHLRYFSDLDITLLFTLKQQFAFEMNYIKQCFRNFIKVKAFIYSAFALFMQTMMLTGRELSSTSSILMNCMVLMLGFYVMFASPIVSSLEALSQSPMARLYRVMSRDDLLDGPLDRPINSVSATLLSYSGKFIDAKALFELAIYNRPHVDQPVDRVVNGGSVLMFRATGRQEEPRVMAPRSPSPV